MQDNSDFNKMPELSRRRFIGALIASAAAAKVPLFAEAEWAERTVSGQGVIDQFPEGDYFAEVFDVQIDPFGVMQVIYGNLKRNTDKKDIAGTLIMTSVLDVRKGDKLIEECDGTITISREEEL